MSPETQVQEILVLEPDRLRGTVLAQTISLAFPTARVYCESEPFAAAEVLADRAITLFVVAVRGFDLDILTLLGVWADHNAGRPRVLVVTPGAQSAALQALRSLPITGIFDCSAGDLRELEFACRAVASGGTYCSQSVRTALIAQTANELESGEAATDDVGLFEEGRQAQHRPPTPRRGLRRRR